MFCFALYLARGGGVEKHGSSTTKFPSFCKSAGVESFKDFGGRELVSPISISFVGSGHLFLDCGLWTDCAALKAAGLYAVHYDTVKSSALMDSALQCSVV